MKASTFEPRHGMLFASFGALIPPLFTASDKLIGCGMVKTVLDTGSSQVYSLKVLSVVVLLDGRTVVVIPITDFQVPFSFLNVRALLHWHGYRDTEPAGR